MMDTIIQVFDTLDLNRNRMALDELYVVIQAILVIIGCIINYLSPKGKKQ